MCNNMSNDHWSRHFLGLLKVGLFFTFCALIPGYGMAILPVEGESNGQLQAKAGRYSVNLSDTRANDLQKGDAIQKFDPGLINVPGDYPTIQTAFNAAQNGDTVLVAAGIYPDSINLADKSIVLASWFLTTGDTGYISQTILDGSGRAAVITIANTVGTATVIDGFTIQNADDGISPNAIFTIQNSHIINCRDGIDYERHSGGLCRNNIFENNLDDGIDLDRDVDIVIENNIIRNNRDDGIEIRLQPYTGPLLNYVIVNNEIYGNGEDGIQIVDYEGRSDRTFIIERNLIYDNDMAGLGCMSDGNTTEDYEGASVLETIWLFNNTFSGNDYGLTGGDSLIAVNNIFVGHPGMASKNVDGGSIVSYDLYWNNGTDLENCNVDINNILFSDPLLDSQFHLLPMSAAIDAGTALFLWEEDTVLNIPAGGYHGLVPDLGVYEFVDSSVVPVGRHGQAPAGFYLSQNHPNPFNPATLITYFLPYADFVVLSIYDILGREIQTPVNEFQPAGGHFIRLDASQFSNGIYVYRLRTRNGFRASRKMLLSK